MKEQTTQGFGQNTNPDVRAMQAKPDSMVIEKQVEFNCGLNNRFEADYRGAFKGEAAFGRVRPEKFSAGRKDW